MKLTSLRKLIGILCLAVGTPLFADSFTFSYSFATSDTLLTGTFKGVQNGAFVENISDLTLSLNGSVLPATFFSAQLDGSGNWLTGPIVSFNSSLNNFAFSDSDLSSGDAGYSHLFFMLYDSVWLGTYFESPETIATDGPTDSGTWTLTNLSGPVSVPDEGVTAGMLLLAFAGLWLLRRQTAA